MQNFGESVTASSGVLRSERRARTEEELLDREERRARAELRDVVRGLGDDALETADLRRHVERHPFVTVTLGALGGFLLARPLRNLIGRVGTRNLGSVVALLGRFGGIAGLVSTLRQSQARFPPR